MSELKTMQTEEQIQHFEHQTSNFHIQYFYTRNMHYNKLNRKQTQNARGICSNLWHAGFPNEEIIRKEA